MLNIVLDKKNSQVLFFKKSVLKIAWWHPLKIYYMKIADYVNGPRNWKLESRVVFEYRVQVDCRVEFFCLFF